MRGVLASPNPLWAFGILSFRLSDRRERAEKSQKIMLRGGAGVPAPPFYKISIVKKHMRRRGSKLAFGGQEMALCRGISGRQLLE